MNNLEPHGTSWAWASRSLPFAQMLRSECLALFGWGVLRCCWTCPGGFIRFLRTRRRRFSSIHSRHLEVLELFDLLLRFLQFLFNITVCSHCLTPSLICSQLRCEFNLFACVCTSCGKHSGLLATAAPSTGKLASRPRLSQAG